MIDLSIVPDSYAQMLIKHEISYDKFLELAEEFCRVFKEAQVKK